MPPRSRAKMHGAHEEQPTPPRPSDEQRSRPPVERRFSPSERYEHQPPPPADDDEYWSKPPPPGEDGQPPWVDVRFEVMKVAAVDTVSATAAVKLYTVYYWTDRRLVGWSKPLPAALWGPVLELTNAMDLKDDSDGEFTLVDADTGRLTRGRKTSGLVSMDPDMEELRAFPFDLDQVPLVFGTWSSWKSLNGERSGTAPKGKTYRLRQVSNPLEGDWLSIGWSGQIAEWEMHGISSNVAEAPPAGAGYELTTVSINFHVSRKSGYYFWKAMLPLYLLTGLSMTTFHFQTDDLASRSDTVSTYFLAAFAMLYVVGDALPKTDFLTKIDVIIVISTVSLALTGAVSLILVSVHEAFGQDVADWWNLRVELAMVGFYVLANLVVFVPAWLKRRSEAAQLTRCRSNSFVEGVPSVGRNSDNEKNPMIADYRSSVDLPGDAPRAVAEGHAYVTLARLPRF